ncbi:gag-pol polyprotein [Tanacetum coccineum]|uniref:Gag-pol polyprotein n=1 Tax=Tanacetum coccineum TaxID=301880 RepID=A0ABQ4YNN9_9ASTR
MLVKARKMIMMFISVESSDNDDTASLDHLSDGEDEVVDIRTQKTAPKTKKKPTKMLDDTFLYIEKEVGPDDEFNVEDHDKLGDHWPIHNPNTKWKFMRPVLGERFEGVEQLKRCVTFYALANGLKLYYERNEGRRLVVRCSRDNHGKAMCPYRLGILDAKKRDLFRNYAKKIMTNPNVKVNEIQEAILKKYKCRVTFGQARRGKIKALEQHETCLEDHYAKLWSYAQEIITSNPGSTCLMGVNPMPDGKTYFKCFYVCFKGLKQGWLEGRRRNLSTRPCFFLL